MCDKICDKILSCGPNDDHHRCSVPCHNDRCPPCDKESTLVCRCGQLTKSTTCVEATQYDPIKNPFCCERKCNKKKMCGKHRLVMTLILVRNKYFTLCLFSFVDAQNYVVIEKYMFVKLSAVKHLTVVFSMYLFKYQSKNLIMIVF